MVKKLFAAAVLLVSLTLAGCGGSSMKEISDKAEKAKTKDQLEAAIGKPDKFEAIKIGVPFESWTYTANDGEVMFTIINGRVQTFVTIPKEQKTIK